MKLRFHANTLRLRLSQSDVARLAESGRVEESITFAPGQVLRYALESGSGTGITVAFEGNRICVRLPGSTARKWIESEQTGIECGSETLRVMVEKDFQCAHPAGEPDPDAFPNPLS